MENRQYPGNLERLKQIYNLFETAMKPFEVACKKKCASCCTCNVTMTGLEAELILSCLDNIGKSQLEQRLVDQMPDNRYHPQLTTNMFARFIIEGKEVPEEENNPLWGQCPLLKDDACTIYAVRPFGCRVLMSNKRCDRQGYASMPPLVLTIATVFQQAVEHLDAEGIFGNLIDVLCAQSQKGEKDQDPRHQFLRNEAIKILMVPEVHRKKLADLIQKLSAILQ